MITSAVATLSVVESAIGRVTAAGAKVLLRVLSFTTMDLNNYWGYNKSESMLPGVIDTADSTGTNKLDVW